MTFNRFAGANHGLVSFSGERFGRVDEVLGTFNRQRRVMLVVPYFSAVPPLVQTTDLIFTVPKPLGEWLAANFDVALRAIPIDVPLTLLCFGIIAISTTIFTDGLGRL